MIIYVIDSSDALRLCVVKDELSPLIKILTENNSRTPILFFANKKDLPEALPVKDIQNALDLDKKGIKYYMVSTNGLTGDGVREGLNWATNNSYFFSK